MVEESNKSPEELKTIAAGLKELQLNLEPIRDKALDQKSFYTGYAQCAETFIKIIVNRANALNQLAEEGDEPKDEQPTVEQLVAEKFKDVEDLPEENSTGDVVEDSSSPE